MLVFLFYFFMFYNRSEATLYFAFCITHNAKCVMRHAFCVL